jgi:phage gp29-like protein
MPFLLGKIPSGDFSDEKKRKDLLASLLQVRSGGAGVGTTETTMDLLNGAAGNNSEAFESHQRYCDEVMTLTVLGQLASSDRGSGLSQGGMQEEVRQDLLEADCAMLSEVVQNRLVDWLCRLRYGLDDTSDMCFVIDCQKAEDLNVRADRDEKIARAAGCKLKRDYVAEVYGVDLEEPEPEPAMIPGAPPAGKKAGDEDIDDDDGQTAMTDEGRKVAKAGDRLIRATLARMVDEDALAAWRLPIKAAIRKAFGDLDLADPELVAKFRERWPAFQASLPGVMDQIDASAFEDALQGAMLAGFLNSALPAKFWRRPVS